MSDDRDTGPPERYRKGDKTKLPLKAPTKARDAHDKAKVGGHRLADLAVSATPERLTKGDTIREEETSQAGKRRTRVETQRVLDRYYVQYSHISKAQYDAGNRLYREWVTAGGNLAAAIGQYEVGAMTQNTQPRGAPASVVAGESLGHVCRFVGPDHWTILMTVVFADHTATEWARAREYPEGSGMVTLKFALNRVAEFYRRQDGGKRRA